MRRPTYRLHCPDLVFWRGNLRVGVGRDLVEDAARCNIRRVIVHHSPDGYEWGYAGSGPADLALNILHRCLPLYCDLVEGEKLYRGRCSSVAWAIHHALKRAFLVSMPHAGGQLAGAVVDAFIDGALEGLERDLFFSYSNGPRMPKYAPRR